MNEHPYLSGPAGCTWPAARPGALGARRPPSALPSAASGAPPPRAAPLGPPGPPQVWAAPGRPPPVPPAARTGTRRRSWLQRAKRRGVNEKVVWGGGHRGLSRRLQAPRVRTRGLRPKARGSRPASLVQTRGLARRRREPSGHSTRVRAHPVCLLGEPHPVPG